MNPTKYFYLKLKENYFETDAVQCLESLENGHIYSLIILKLHLKALKGRGKLMMTETIPYSVNNIKTLAHVIRHDLDHVKQAIREGVDLGIVEIINSEEIFISDMQAFIGKSSTEADRKRVYRNMIDQKKEIEDKTTDKCPVELNLELKKELNKENNNSRFPEETDKNSIHFKTKEISIEDSFALVNKPQLTNWVLREQEKEDMEMFLKNTPKIKKTPFDQNPDNIEFFNHWSQFEELQSNKLETVKRHWKKKYNDLISDYTDNDIFYAIDQYAFIKSNPELFWFEYDWAIWDFIGRGLTKFLSHANPTKNFRNKYKNVTTEMIQDAESKWIEKYSHVREKFTRKE